jgi:hypothetical protein
MSRRLSHQVAHTFRRGVMAGYGFWGTFGIITGALSIFNLIVLGFQLGLPSVLKALLDAYRYTFHRLFLDPVWDLLKFDVPYWLNDMLVIWIAGAAISLRTLTGVRRHYLSHWRWDQGEKADLGLVEQWLFGRSHIVFGLIAAATSFLFWPVLWARFIYSDPLMVAGKQLVTVALPRGSTVTYRKAWLVQVLSILTLVALLLITSAGLPPTN